MISGRRVESIEVPISDGIQVSGSLLEAKPQLTYYGAGQLVLLSLKGLCWGSIAWYVPQNWLRSSFRITREDTGQVVQTSTKWVSCPSIGGCEREWRDDRIGIRVPGSMPAHDLHVTVELHVGGEYSSQVVDRKSFWVPYKLGPDPVDCVSHADCPTGYYCGDDGKCYVIPPPVPPPDNGNGLPPGNGAVGAFPWEWALIGAGAGLGLLLIAGKKMKQRS